MDQSSVRKFICLVILLHEENILADFYMCYNHTLGSEKTTLIYTNLLHLSWPLKWNQIQHISYTLIVFLLRHTKGFKLKIKNNTSCIWCYKCSTHFTGENYTSKDYTKMPLITITQQAYFHFIKCNLTIYIVNILYILLLITATGIICILV